jgi:hypothetical protein
MIASLGGKRAVITSAYIQTAFFGLGAVYCLYCIAFRWTAIWDKYGRFGLYGWLGAALFLFSLTGWLVAVVVWFIQRQFSN